MVVDDDPGELGGALGEAADQFLQGLVAGLIAPGQGHGGSATRRHDQAIRAMRGGWGVDHHVFKLGRQLFDEQAKDRAFDQLNGVGRRHADGQQIETGQ